MNTNQGDQIRVDSCRFVVRNLNQSSGFSLVIALVMVALMAVIAVGVFTVVSLERVTATSYSSRYQADLATQNGLQAAAKTLVATPTGTTSITGKDTFLIVRADGQPDANGNRAAYYYLAQPSPSPGNSITYYPLFSASTDPRDLSVVQTPTINLAAPAAPAVPTPAPPANSSGPNDGTAWNAAGTQRLPGLYPWQQPNSPSGPSVKWVEMRDPQDAPSPAPHGLPYTRYAYWVEDLDGYLDASQVNDPNAVTARGNGTGNGTSPGEIAMFSIFTADPSQQAPSPVPTPVANLVSNRNLLFTVPTLWQIPAVTEDLAGPNLAVRLGVDNNPGEQNLVPLGYGYGRNDASQLGEGYLKAPINPISQLRGNISGKFSTPISTAMPNFALRTVATQPSGFGHSGQTKNYISNLGADLIDYAFPSQAPTNFAPPGNPNAPPTSRGIGAYPLVVSVYDLNNWVQTYPDSSSGTWKIVVEVMTYVQFWNPHHSTDPNNPNFPVKGLLRLTYNNSDKIQLTDNNKTFTLSRQPDTNVIFTDNPSSDTNKPVITSPLTATGKPGQLFQYQIVAGNGRQFPPLQSDTYQVVKMPGPPISPITSYSASGLPSGLSLSTQQNSLGLISGRPKGGVGTYNVTIGATNSYGTTPPATLVITIK